MLFRAVSVSSLLWAERSCEAQWSFLFDEPLANTSIIQANQ